MSRPPEQYLCQVFLYYLQQQQKNIKKSQPKYLWTENKKKKETQRNKRTDLFLSNFYLINWEINLHCFRKLGPCRCRSSVELREEE